MEDRPIGRERLFNSDEYFQSEKYQHVMSLTNEMAHGRIPGSEVLLNEAELSTWQDWRPHLDFLRLDLLRNKEIQRLRFLLQIAWKASAAKVRRQNKKRTDSFLHQNDAGEEFKKPADHNRLDHSILIAELGTILAAKLHFSLDEVKRIYAAALCHDIGHSAFNHVADRFLCKQGFADHEERGVNKLYSPQFRNTLALHGIEPEEIHSIIQENGKLGALQKIGDTLSYLYLDCRNMEMPAFTLQDLLVILQDVDGIEENYNVPDVILAEAVQLKIKCSPQQTVLRVKTGEHERNQAWQKRFLEVRARLYETLYSSQKDNLEEKGRLNLVKMAIDEGFLSYKDLLECGDKELRLRLLELVTTKMTRYKSLYEFAFGIHQPQDWRIVRFTSPDEVFATLSQLPPGVLRRTVEADAPPTGKTLVLLRDDQPVLLYATSWVNVNEHLVAFPVR